MKLKSLALAALAAVSAPSFASIITHDATEFGGAELVLIVTKESGSYVQDLGISVKDIYTQLSTTGSFTQSVAGIQWDAYNAFAGTGGKWAVQAYQAIDIGLAPGETNAWVTRGAGQVLGNMTNDDVNQAVGLIPTYLFNKVDEVAGEEHVRLASPNTVASYADSTTVAMAGVFGTTNEFGQATTMLYMTPANDTLFGKALYSTMANSFGNAYEVNFDGANITITAAVPAVPEPSTYAMLIGGLLAVGFVARRRASK